MQSLRRLDGHLSVLTRHLRGADRLTRGRNRMREIRTYGSAPGSHDGLIYEMALPCSYGDWKFIETPTNLQPIL